MPTHRDQLPLNMPQLPSDRPLRVALVYPPFEDKRDRSAYYVAPPLGLLYLASYLEKDGHIVSLNDFIFDIKNGTLVPTKDIYKECAELIIKSEPDVVCISTQCTTSPGSVNISIELKKLNPNVLIIFGGHDVSFIAELYLERFSSIDLVLTGEAEKSITMLFRSLRGHGQLDDVPGLHLRTISNGQKKSNLTSRIQHLDEILLPAYHLAPPLSQYFNLSRVPTILIDSGRGCAFSCEFCQTTLLSGHGIRYRTIDSIIYELKRLISEYGVFEAYFVHDLFTARRSFVESLCDRLIDEDLGITWQCRCRLDQVDKPLLKKMAQAGCRMLLYGVESGSAETLVRMNKLSKASSPEAIIERVAWTVEAGIFPSLSMVVGTPEESLDDLDATMGLALQFLRLGSVNAFIQLMSPLPGTALAQRTAHRFHYRGENAPTAFSQGIEFDNGRRVREDDELIIENPDIFQSFQTVIPDHGDLDLCIDVSLVYCKLLEVYQRSFGQLMLARNCSHIDLFSSWRRDWLTKRGSANLAGATDSQIWRSFEVFFEAELARLPPSRSLSEAYRFDRCLRSASESPPVVPSKFIQCAPKYEIAAGAHLYKSDTEVEGIPKGVAVMIYATADRLHVLRLNDQQEELLLMLTDPSIFTNLTAAYQERLASSLRELISVGVICGVVEEAIIDHRYVLA